MADYHYTAINQSGQTCSGLYEEVDGISGLRDELAKLGFRLVKAKKQRAINTAVKIKQADVVTFAYKFAGMCGAGLTIVQCLDTLEKQAENHNLKFIVADIKKNVETGSSLTDAFDKYRPIFSDFFLGMLEAGESGGRLAECLEISAKYLERQAEIKGKIKAAFTYPVIVLIMCFVIIAALVVFVVPVFSKIYRQLGVPLPGPTQLLVISSVIMRQWWPLILILAGTMPFILRYFRSNKYLKSRWDDLKFEIPLIGRFCKLVTVAHFTRSFAMLLQTGVPLIKAFKVASMVANNEKVSQICIDIQKTVQSGGGVSEAFEKHNLFPPLLVQLAASGEEAGVLAEMLNKGVDFLEKDIERMTNSMLVKLEPVLTLAMGAVIGLILMAVYLPMFDYMSHLK